MHELRHTLRAFTKMTLAGLRAFGRDRTALVWGFLLPAFLMVLFGALFGNADSDRPSRLTVGLVLEDGGTDPATAWVPGAFAQVPVIETRVGTLKAETDALRAGKRRAVAVFPADFAARLSRGESTPVRLLYDPTQPQPATQAALGILRQVVATMDRRMIGAPELLTARDEPLPLTVGGGRASRHGRALDYILPGLFGMTAMQLGLFTAIPLINLREKGVLKRLRGTPVAPGLVIGSQVAQRLCVAAAQAVILLGVGRGVFHFHTACHPLAVLPLLLFGVLIFIGIGITLASFARTQEAGSSLVQVVNLPLMLFSGLLIPAEMLPGFVRGVMAFLPTTYLGDALRQLMLGVPGAYPMSTDLAVLAAWFALTVTVATRAFRWE